MAKIVHIIGNGIGAHHYDPKSEGMKYTCNLPPFPVPGAKATFMVDFKMMAAMLEGSVTVPGEWILGARPKIFMNMQPGFYMKHAPQIKEFFLDKPDYAPDYTAFNCGHMAVYYAAKKLKADEVHMYGFDSIFDFDLRSCTDFYLNSDRTVQNNARLTNNWRPIWQGIFNEFKGTTFYLHHHHNAIKFPVPDNTKVIVHKKQ